MGSTSDWEVMRHASETLERLGVPHETRVVSAHRTPDLLYAYAETAEARGLQVLIAGAGGAAHLPGHGRREDAAAGARRADAVAPPERPRLARRRSCRCPPASPSARSRSARRARSTRRCSRRPILARSRPDAARGARALPPRADRGGARDARPALGLIAAHPDRRLHRRRPARPHARARGRAARRRRALPRSVRGRLRGRRLRADRGRLRRSRGARAARLRRDLRHLRVRERAGRGARRAARADAASAPARTASRSRRTGSGRSSCSGASACPAPPSATSRRPAQLDDALARTGLPAVIKTKRMGYDGKGQRVVRTREEAEQAVAELGDELIAEALVPFRRELSLVLVRGLDLETVFYPLVENVHVDGILSTTTAPAPGRRSRAAGHLRGVRARGRRGAAPRRRALPRALRDRRRRARERARAARAQLGPLDDRGSRDEPVREPHPRGARPAARLHRAARAVAHAEPRRRASAARRAARRRRPRAPLRQGTPPRAQTGPRDATSRARP